MWLSNVEPTDGALVRPIGVHLILVHSVSLFAGRTQLPVPGRVARSFGLEHLMAFLTGLENLAEGVHQSTGCGSVRRIRTSCQCCNRPRPGASGAWSRTNGGLLIATAYRSLQTTRRPPVAFSRAVLLSAERPRRHLSVAPPIAAKRVWSDYMPTLVPARPRFPRRSL